MFLSTAFVVLLLAACAGAGFVCIRRRAFVLDRDCRNAFLALDAALAQRQDQTLSLLERLNQRGLLQRQVRESVQTCSSTARATRLWAAQSPHSLRAAAKIAEVEAALTRALEQALDSVRPATLQEPGLQHLVLQLTQANARGEALWREFNQAVHAVQRHLRRQPRPRSERTLGLRPMVSLSRP